MKTFSYWKKPTKQLFVRFKQLSEKVYVSNKKKQAKKL